MAAGKNYLDTTKFKGIPAAIPVYHDCVDDGTLSLTPGTYPQQVTNMKVFKDGTGFFILAPLDPASITGLSDLVQ